MKVKVKSKRFILFLLAVLTVYIGIMHYKATLDGINVAQDSKKYTELTKEEKGKNEKLKKEKEAINTSDSYKKIAREKLGLLESDETVYVNSDSN